MYNEFPDDVVEDAVDDIIRDAINVDASVIGGIVSGLIAAGASRERLMKILLAAAAEDDQTLTLMSNRRLPTKDVCVALVKRAIVCRAEALRLRAAKTETEITAG